jgi:hypothetical protein
LMCTAPPVAQLQLADMVHGLKTSKCQLLQQVMTVTTRRRKEPDTREGARYSRVS